MARLLLMALALLVACEGKDDTDPADDTDDTDVVTWTLDDLNGRCAFEDRVGGFELAQWDSPLDGFSTVTGSVAEGTVPTTILFEAETEGDCTLWRKENPFCDPTCEAGQTCTHAGECVPYPAKQNVGDVVIEGIGETLTLSPDTYNNYWNTTVDHPLFEPGAMVSATSSSFELRGLGVDTLAIDEIDWAVVRGQDLHLSWTPGEAESRIVLSFNVDQHGNSPVTMFCNTEDSGAVVVSAKLLKVLLDYGVSGYSTGTIRRVTVDSTEVADGCIDLAVYSHVTASLSVDGHIPCTREEDCPKGQHCDLSIQTCVDD
ncbi:MAG: hypothetical protein HN348_17010 [Proteobacteria bacterium]|nr:hypothetical protein [Pseudomonadota bacterium]